MFEGKTAEGLAMANAAILIGLIEELIERRVMVRAHPSELLQETVNKLENCPAVDWSNAVGAIAIIRSNCCRKFPRPPARISRQAASRWPKTLPGPLHWPTHPFAQETP